MLVERITPWLLDVGSWIFGGLIAFSVILVGALLTIGPVDATILVAITAFALVLPLEVGGLCLLRLARDLGQVVVEAEIETYQTAVRQVLQSAAPASGPTMGQLVAAPPPREAVRRRRTGFALSYSAGFLALSGVLTLVGMIAALWHMAWWIAVAFAVMVLISLILTTIAIVTAEPPDSPEEKERMRRLGQEFARRVSEQYQRPNENNERA